MTLKKKLYITTAFQSFDRKMKEKQNKKKQKTKWKKKMDEIQKKKKIHSAE